MGWLGGSKQSGNVRNEARPEGIFQKRQESCGWRVWNQKPVAKSVAVFSIAPVQLSPETYTFPMKIRTLFTSSLLALALGSVAFAQPAPGGGAPAMGGPGGPGGPGGAPANATPKTDLEKLMAKINESQGTPRGAFTAGNVADLADAAKKDEALKRIGVIKESATAALKLAPKYVPPTAMTEADKAKVVADFQATMKKFITAIEALETAVKAGKTAEAPALWTAANDLHTDAHGTYRAPRPAGGARGGPGGGAPGGAPGGGAPGGAPAPRGN